MWAGRTAGSLDKIADDFNSSIHIDSVMYKEDILGSQAHAAMLAEAGILTEAEAEKNAADPALEPSTAQDDGELVAVITAAVAAMIESSEYKNEFAGGFRVVSFKRSEKTAWNRK